MDLDSLKSFYHVAKEGSFSRAAKILHVSQPAMSVRIKTLETELDERLFDRERKGVALTEAGAVLFESAEKIFGDVDEALTRLRELRESGGGRVRLGCSDTASMNLLPPVLRRFRKKFPSAEITIRNAYSRGILDLLVRGELDFGIVSRPASVDRRLEVSPLFADPFVFVTQKNDPLLRRSEISLSALDGRPMVALEKGTHTRETVDRALRQAGARPQVVLETGNIEVQKLYASAGFGFALVPESALLTNDRRRLQVRPLKDGGLERTMAVVVPKARYLSRAATALIAMLRESVA
ncbi:MAG: LysR family transcriptional regulator [Planctomycetota bacterium]